MIFNRSKIVILIVLALNSLMVSAKVLQHPTIWITQDERSEVLNLIEQYNWAKSIVEQLHARVDNSKDEHLTNPQSLLNSIPEFGGNLEEHNAILTLAAESGMLYYLTEDKIYAQLSADIIAAYISHLSPLTPQTTEVMGSAFHDPRTCYNMLALAYDFTYNYLKSGEAMVFNKAISKREPFNNEKAQQAFKNMIGSVMQEYGKPDIHGHIISNHPVLTAPGVLYSILCLEDSVERERLFNVFWETGTKHQPSFKHTILPMFSGQGIWPESLSYSFMPNISLVLNIIDRIKPEMDVTKDYKHIFEGNFMFAQLKNPNGTFVRYGDSKRYNDNSAENYRYVLHLAERRGYEKLKTLAEVTLNQEYQAKGGYKPELTDHPYDNGTHLQLFWGVNFQNEKAGRIDYKPTVIVKHAGVALQRNFVEKDNELYGLCGIIGGAHYVHSHVTGIAMELYGAGYVMGPNAGLPKTVKERRIPLHEHYFRLYAGNNTVIVNGTSHGRDEGSWKGKANVWQNTTVNIAAEPKHLQDPVCDKFNFATQFLKDEINNCDQQRTLSVIRTSKTTGYYFDLFRSKSLDENKFHDYIYHNLGDETQILNAKNKALAVTETDRYQNDIGDVVHSPGWRYFENTKVTKATKKATNVRFHIQHNDRYMHMFIPGGIKREYTKALAPPTREARNGYIDKKTQVVAIRQQGEAWDRPYIAVFEPSINRQSSVQSIEPLMDGKKVVGAKVISKVQGTVITDYIISQDEAGALYHNNALNLHFKGRFGIVRTEKSSGKSSVSLYIGEGKELSFNTHNVKADAQNKGFKKGDL